METAFARHPLYAGSTREELDSAVEVRESVTLGTCEGSKGTAR